MRNQQFYQMMYQQLDNEGPSYVDWVQEEVDAMLQQISVRIHNALELGSGTGVAAIALGLQDVQVTAIELDQGAHQRALINQEQYPSTIGKVTFELADFMTYQLEHPVDLVYYRDGFGVSDDAFQQQVLQRVAHWLTKQGRFFVDVYNPNFWQNADGQTLEVTPSITRCYTYDSQTQVFRDEWRDKQGRFLGVQQLKCYSMQQIARMAEQAGLKIESVRASGKMDYEQYRWIEQASLEDCMYFHIVMRP